MIPSLKAEFRKLLTVRSTYFIVLISLVIVALFAGFGDGFRADAAHLHDPTMLTGESTSAIVFVGLILAFAGLLLLGHEYRYNGVLYTLTSSNSRIRSLFAKVLAVSVFALLTSMLVAFFAPLCAIIGVHLAGKHIGPQVFDVWSVLWRCMLCGWGYALYAFILVGIIRNQIGAIVTFLLVPLIGESIIGSIFKSSVKYLPFNAVQSIAAPGHLGNNTTSGHAAVTVLIYVVVGMLVATILFVRRDAN
jgi:hypothetical protein